jgi:hypothetical protein
MMETPTEVDHMTNILIFMTGIAVLGILVILFLYLVLYLIVSE